MWQPAHSQGAEAIPTAHVRRLHEERLHRRLRTARHLRPADVHEHLHTAIAVGATFDRWSGQRWYERYLDRDIERLTGQAVSEMRSVHAQRESDEQFTSERVGFVVRRYRRMVEANNSAKAARAKKHPRLRNAVLYLLLSRRRG